MFSLPCFNDPANLMPAGVKTAVGPPRPNLGQPGVNTVTVRTCRRRCDVESHSRGHDCVVGLDMTKLAFSPAVPVPCRILEANLAHCWRNVRPTDSVSKVVHVLR